MYTAIATTLPYCDWQVWMPNLHPKPITTAKRLVEYHASLVGTQELFERYNPVYRGYKMQHNIALKLDQDTTPEILCAAAEEMDRLGLVRILKIYPDGVTTNSAGGWNDLSSLYPAIEAAIELGYIICLHGEQPGPMIDTYGREERFLNKSFAPLVEKFPQGKFHLEHITTKAAVDMVFCMPYTVGAGITLHHLVMTRNDVLEHKEWADSHPGMNPHHHCRPPAQTFEDQKTLLMVALNASDLGNHKFHFGSDSAGHLKRTKQTSCCCAGVQSSPVTGPVLASLFDAAGKLDSPDYEAFVGGNAMDFYGITSRCDQTFELEYRPWIVPHEYGGIVPMYANQVLEWTPRADHLRSGIL